MKAFRAGILLLLITPLALQVSAQVSSSVNGIAGDATGAIVSNMQVVAVDVNGKEAARIATGSDGHFTLRDLVEGTYTLTNQATNGFGRAKLSVTVKSKMQDVRLVIPVASVEQTVTVTEPSVSTEANANKDTVDLSSDSLESLPVFDQDYIATLTPFLDQSSLGTGGAQITIDGVPANILNITPSAIKSIRINNDPYSAESNRPGRARIDIFTKQPGKDFHGTLNLTFRDSALNAANYFAPIKAAEQRRIYEGSLLGPLYKAYGFLLSANRREQDLAASIHAIGPQGLIASNVATPTRDDSVNFRVARDFSATHSAYLQYRYGDSSAINQGVGGLVLPEAGSNATSREDQITFNDRLVLTPNLVNSFGITLEKSRDTVQSVTSAPSVTVNGAFTGGGAQADLNRTEDTLLFNEVVSWSHGRHFVRFGANVPQLSRRIWDDRTNRLGTFGFASLADYQSSHPYVYTVQQGLGRSVYWFNEIGGFVQDQVKLSNTVSLSLGLRYDWQTYLNDNNNFAPRASLAWAPAKGSGTVFRLGSGVFFDRTGGDTLSNVTLHDGVRLRSYQVENPGFPNPNVNLATLPSNYVRFSPAIRTPYSIQYSAGVEQKLFSKATLTVGYRGSVGIGLLRSRDTNAPVGPAYSTRPDPAAGSYQSVESEGRQLVNALDVNYQGNVSRWFTGLAQYTLSRTFNNTNGIFFLPQNQLNPNGEWGRSSADRLHRLNVLGNFAFGKWYAVGASLTAYSAAPYTETLGTDPYGDGLGNARPVGVPRNSLQGGSDVSLDLRWAHDWNVTKAKGDQAKVLTFGVDAFDVLNHPDFTTYSGSLSSPLFGQPTVALAGRQIQLTARFKF